MASSEKTTDTDLRICDNVHDLGVDDKTKFVLLCSFPTNQLIKQSMVYHEVHFMDCKN